MADEFYPRLTDEGILNNPLWYSDNPFYQSGYGMPNCTCYVWGRCWEIGGGTPEHKPTFSGANAEYWYNYSDGYERGSAPALGAVLCLADGPFSGDGHVAVVEEIFPDGSITVSESAWAAYFFKTERLYPPYYLTAAGYVFQGFIYYPYGGGKPVGAGKKIWYFKKLLWKNEKDILL